MVLFKRQKDFAVQSLTLKIVNNNCPELRAQLDGPRLDTRVNLTLVVMVIPFKNGEPMIGETFIAVTKDFSSAGVSVVLNGPRALHEAILGFRFEGEMHFVRAKAKHLNPMGGGFFQIGFNMLDVISVHDYPKLKSMSF